MTHALYRPDTATTNSLHRLSPLALISILRNGVELGRQRRQLAMLDAKRLADIGLTRQAAREEATRRFWDAPRHLYR